MCLSARLFQCALCFAQTLICRHCDRGHQYCSKACSDKARQSSRKRANQRYAQTTKGKHNNAERQRRFRLAQSKKVTDQGSESQPVRVFYALSVFQSLLISFFPPIGLPQSRVCHFCAQQIDVFVRNDFLHRSIEHRRW